jgi:hypothetical protein
MTRGHVALHGVALRRLRGGRLGFVARATERGSGNGTSPGNGRLGIGCEYADEYPAATNVRNAREG